MSTDPVAWAGFVDTGDLEVAMVHEETGIDTLAMFVLRGSPANIDRALAAAEFSAAFTPGVGTQPPIEGFDLTELDAPQFAEDRWRSPSGKTLTRLVVRGGTPEGPELVHVWAFTT